VCVCCVVSSDSMTVCVFVVVSSDSVARLWTVQTGEVKREYTGHQKAVVALAFKEDTPD